MDSFLGAGGIENGIDAIKFIMAGASLVQVCTAAVKYGHSIYGRIASKMAGWLDDHDRNSLDEIRGLFDRNLRLLDGDEDALIIDPKEGGFLRAIVVFGGD